MAVSGGRRVGVFCRFVIRAEHMNQQIRHSQAFSRSDDLHAEVRKQLVHWVSRAREITGADVRRLPIPDLRFDLRGRAAGQTVFRKRGQGCLIRVNEQLLQEHPGPMLQETVPHEVAHAVVYLLHGRRIKPHGAEWRAMMHAFGLPATVCHTLPAEPMRRLERFRYACGCSEPVWLTSIRHRRACSGTAYRCRRCGEILKYSGG